MRKVAIGVAVPLPPMSSDEGYRWRYKARKRKKRLHRLRQAIKAALRQR